MLKKIFIILTLGLVTIISGSKSFTHNNDDSEALAQVIFFLTISTLIIYLTLQLINKFFEITEKSNEHD